MVPIPPPPPPPPASGQPIPMERPAESRPVAQQAAPTRVITAHRQYFDQRRKRYYYFDPARRAYFWEDGSPKN